MNKIDIVITWVNSQDPIWLKSYIQASREKEGSFENSKLRFKDWGTLKFVFRMIETHLPWVNCIYLVTADQKPEWININHDKLKIISHKQIFDSEAFLPVFNSTAIELCLSNIPGLSENFIIWNDDFYLFRNLTPDAFFMNNMPVDALQLRFRIPHFLSFLRKSPTSSINVVKYSQLKAIEYVMCKNILKKPYLNFILKFFQIKVWHHPQPHKKKLFQHAIQFFHDEALKIKSSRFRAQVRFNQYLMRFITLLTGNYVQQDKQLIKHSYSVFISSLSDLKDTMKLCDATETTFVCLCETKDISEDVFESCASEFVKYLSLKYPSKSSFEL